MLAVIDCEVMVPVTRTEAEVKVDPMETELAVTPCCDRMPVLVMTPAVSAPVFRLCEVILPPVDSEVDVIGPVRSCDDVMAAAVSAPVDRVLLIICCATLSDLLVSGPVDMEAAVSADDNRSVVAVIAAAVNGPVKTDPEVNAFVTDKLADVIAPPAVK